MIRRVARIWKRRGAFLKEWDNCKRPWPEFSLLLNQIQTIYPKLRRIFWPKPEIQTDFPPKNRWSQKKRKRSSPKLKRIFRSKSEIQTVLPAESRQLLTNFGTKSLRGGLFSFFFSKNQPQKHQKRAILHTFQASGWLEHSPPPPGYAAVHDYRQDVAVTILYSS